MNQTTPDLYELYYFINGKKVAGTNGGRVGDVFNPSLGVKVAEVPLASKAEVESAIAVAQKTKGLTKLAGIPRITL